MKPIRISSAWRIIDDRDAYELRLLVPVRTVSETNQREHWAKRHRRRSQVRVTVGLVAAGALGGSVISAPIEVQLVRQAPSSGLDDDNLVSSLKAARDGVADALGIDDRDPRVSWSYAQRRGDYAVEVVIVRPGKVANAS